MMVILELTNNLVNAITTPEPHVTFYNLQRHILDYRSHSLVFFLQQTIMLANRR